MNRWVAVVLTVVLSAGAGCRHDAPAPQVAPNFELRVRDNLEARRFEIALSSLDSRAVCLSVDQWPTSYGGLDGGSQLASVLVDGELFPAADENFGICPGGCGFIRVDAGQVLTAFIGYDQFKDAGQLIDRTDKKLKYEVHPKQCSKGMEIVEPR